MIAARLRPLTPDDAPAAVALIHAAFAAARRRAGEDAPEVDEQRHAAQRARMARFARTDGPGAWAAEGPDGLVGIGVALRRAHLWGLALLFVHPDHQSGGGWAAGCSRPPAPTPRAPPSS